LVKSLVCRAPGKWSFRAAVQSLVSNRATQAILQHGYLGSLMLGRPEERPQSPLPCYERIGAKFAEVLDSGNGEAAMGRLRIKRPKPKRRRSSLRMPPAGDLTAYDPTPDPTDLLGLKGTAAGRYVGLYRLGDFGRGLRSRQHLRRYRGKGRRDPLVIFLVILTGLVLVTILLGLVVPGR
jgi:hypothetical protein